MKNEKISEHDRVLMQKIVDSLEKRNQKKKNTLCYKKPITKK